MEQNFKQLDLVNEHIADNEPQEDNELSIILDRETGNINGTTLTDVELNLWQSQNEGIETDHF
jgi:hypothetical protein